jgi:hypothetical protein
MPAIREAEFQTSGSCTAGAVCARAKETSMQVQKKVSLLVIPVAIATQGLAAHAADDAPASPQPVQAVATDTGVPVSGTESATPSTTSTPSASATTPAPAAVSQDAQQPGFGVAMTDDQLDEHRGGDALIGQNYLNGTLSDTEANRVVTGSNTISDGSFANSSGLPTVIQNTGANVLIQNATVLNVRFGN